MFPIRRRYFCEMHVCKNVPRVTEVAKTRPSNTLQPRLLRISNELSLVTNRNVFIIF